MSDVQFIDWPEERRYLQDRFGHQAYNRAAKAWNQLTSRAGGKYGRTSYKDVEVRMTRSEFFRWAVPEYAQWHKQHPKTSPSLDRINDGHYELGNLQLITRADNARKSPEKRNHFAPDGTSWCCRCQEYLPKDRFYRDASTSHGLSPYCIPCISERSKIARRKNPKVNPQLRYIEHDGERLTVTEWAERVGISRFVIFARLKAGWSPERALTTPVRPRKKQ